MKLGQRNYALLKELLSNPNTVTGKELETKLRLTRKQLDYSLLKVNEYLAEKRIPALKRLPSGRILVSEAVKGLDMARLERESTDIWLQPEERLDILRFMLLTSHEPLSLQHFIGELKASKNTILTDLKTLKESLSQEELSLTYSREHGYLINGSEYALRQQIFAVLRDILPSHEKSLLAHRISGLDEAALEESRRFAETIEDALSTQFNDEMIAVNILFFFFLLQRIRNGHTLAEIPDVLRHVAGTKEYMVMQSCLASQGVHDINETVYLTAHIQSMRINSQLEMVAGTEQAERAVEMTVANFERLACIQLRRREDTLRLLRNHCIPALYRIRYNFHIGPDISEYVLPTYQEVHDIVKKSVGPLETLAGKPFPEEELAYITLIFTAQTRSAEDEAPERRLSAVVVCQNGVSVSHFLLTSLRRTFPEIEFITYLSMRQFYQYQGEYDLVFTAVPLQTPKKQFVIEPLMNTTERKNLRRNVLESMGDTGQIFPQAETILQIIRKHTNESVFKKLRMEIDLYMAQSDVDGPRRTERQKPTLADLWVIDNLRVSQASMGWREAIEFAAIPLLYKRVIEYRYVDAMVASIAERKPMLLVADGVIIAHAAVDAGVKNVGLSVLVLPEPISIYGYMEANVILVLAAPDYERHLPALNQLIELLEDEVKLAALKTAKLPDDILKLLNYKT